MYRTLAPGVVYGHLAFYASLTLMRYEQLPGNIKAVMRTNSISWSIWHCEVNRKSTIYCIVKVVISAFRFLDQEITVLRSFLKLKFSVLSMPFYQLCSKTWKIHWRIIWKPAMGLRRKIRGKKQYSGVIAKWYMTRAYLPSIRKGSLTPIYHLGNPFFLPPLARLSNVNLLLQHLLYRLPTCKH